MEAIGEAVAAAVTNTDSIEQCQETDSPGTVQRYQFPPILLVVHCHLINMISLWNVS